MITVLTGENASALQQHLQQIKKEFIAKHSKAGVEVINGEGLEKEDIAGLLQGATLFSTARLVIIKNVSQNKTFASELALQLENVADDTDIVFVDPQLDKRTIFFKELKKHAEIKNFENMNVAAAVSWVVSAVSEGGSVISRQDADFLVQRVGVDQSRLGNEVEKLLLFDKKITQNSIKQVVEEDPKETIFQLLDDALSGKKKQALHVLRQLELAQNDAHQIVGMLIWQVNIVAIVYSAGNSSDGEVAKQMKISPFVVSKTRHLVKRLAKQKVQQIVEAAAYCDEQLKLSGAKPFSLLEVAVLRIAQA